MSAAKSEASELEKAVAYYKKRLDELGTAYLQKDFKISALHKEVTQKRNAFALLTSLYQSIGGFNDVSQIFKTAIEKISTTLEMDRVFILVEGEEENSFRVEHIVGMERLPDNFTETIAHVRFNISHQFTKDPKSFIIANKGSEPSELVDKIQRELYLPNFVSVPIISEGKAIGILIAGRLKEVNPVTRQMDEGDVETLHAVTGFLVAIVQSLRVSALEEMDRLKTDFFANLSHEFRTPITLTIGPLESLLKGRHGELSDEIKSQMEMMRRNQVRLLQLINQILDLAKLESGQLDLKVKRVLRFNDFIKQRIEQFTSVASERGVATHCQFDTHLDTVMLFIDAEKFDKIIFNLLSNALKFTKKGSIEVQTELRDNTVRVVVKDTGIGIRSDQLPFIFDRFRQADGSSSREFAGTGIGLAMVKELIRLHGGEITARSVFGSGTTMEISFPVGNSHFTAAHILEGAVEDDSLDSVAQARVISVSEGARNSTSIAEIDRLNKEMEMLSDASRPVIVYAEDNADLRNYVREVLKREFNIYVAGDGKDGLEKIRYYKPILILSDVMMPVMTGSELCAAVRNDLELKATPFILLTAKSDTESKVQNLEIGADDYLNKPFSEHELVVRIRNLIRMREQHLRLKAELQAARAIQQSLLPPLSQTWSGHVFEALYHPCEELSGDFFDTIQVGEWWYVYLVDITSHGTAAAQVTYLIKSLFAEALSDGRAPPLSELLQTLAHAYSKFTFTQAAGLQVARFHPKARTFDFSYSNAPQPVVMSEGKANPIRCRPGPLLVGGLAEEEIGLFPSVSIQLDPGQSVFLFSDGSYEFTTDADQEQGFGYMKFCRLLQNSGGPQHESQWRDGVFKKLSELNGGVTFTDDMTILKISIKGD